MICPGPNEPGGGITCPGRNEGPGPPRPWFSEGGLLRWVGPSITVSAVEDVLCKFEGSGDCSCTTRCGPFWSCNSGESPRWASEPCGPEGDHRFSKLTDPVREGGENLFSFGVRL